MERTAIVCLPVVAVLVFCSESVEFCGPDAEPECYGWIRGVANSWRTGGDIQVGARHVVVRHSQAHAVVTRCHAMNSHVAHGRGRHPGDAD